MKYRSLWRASLLLVVLGLSVWGLVSAGAANAARKPASASAPKARRIQVPRRSPSASPEVKAAALGTATSASPGVDVNPDITAKSDASVNPDSSVTLDAAAESDAAVAAGLNGAAGAPAIGSVQDPLTREENAFFFDLRQLTSHPNRLSGSRNGYDAAEYIAAQLTRLGVQTLFIDMPVWQMETERAELLVEGQRIEVHPLRPNISALSVTGPEGLTGPLLYLGRGELADYGERKVEGALVVLDYDSVGAWQRAFAYGAKAVLFLENGKSVASEPRHSGVPANWVRAYIPAGQTGLDLRIDHPNAQLSIESHWRRTEGRNIVARIPGTAPGFAGAGGQAEAVVLSANYDTFGIVPELSPGARGAANVAALLQAAATLKQHPAKRDVVLLFLDNQARYHQGAREVYETWMRDADEHARRSEQHRKELLHVRAMELLLSKNGLVFDHAIDPPGEIMPKVWLKRALVDVANFKRDDVRKVMEVLRLKAGRAGALAIQSQVHELEAEALRWDEIRRALHQGELSGFVKEKTLLSRGKSPVAKLFQTLFEQLKEATSLRFQKRLNELTALVEMDEQRTALRKALSPDGKPLFVVFHAQYNLSDAGPSFGPVVGDWTNALTPWRMPAAGADAPGYYGRLLGALREVASQRPAELSHLDARTLADPLFGLTFAPGPFATSSSIAGTYGIYNFSLMSGADRRPRDGQPSDTLEELAWLRLEHQAVEATELMQRAASSPEISLPRVLTAVNLSRYPTWDAGAQAGDYAGLQVSGSMAEDRPAGGAMIALWPGSSGYATAGEAWSSLKDAQGIADFEPLALETVDQNGRFRLLGLRTDIHTEIMVFGSQFDAQGRIQAVTTQEGQVKLNTELIRVNLFFGDQYRWMARRGFESDPKRFKLLKANSDAPFRDNRSLWGQLGDQYFGYVSDQIVDRRLKIFQVMGSAALGVFSDKSPYGNGLDPKDVSGSFSIADHTASDLWKLNETRLSQLRIRGVTSPDIEVLHGRALRIKEQAKTEPNLAGKMADLGRSAALSQRVYLPLRNTMDDLVHAIVMLLLLASPFAFALERLVICATTIYGRLAGFTGMFLGTFGLLYLMHPGFAIAATPVIIFLAFAILLLSSLVIYIVVRKFKTELKAMQGQALGVHGLEVSRMGTMLAAVGMGMSTMRRRPTRTTLTAVTVVILTFTTLVFASFSQKVGIRTSYEGPKSPHTRASILVHQLDYTPLPEGVKDLMFGQQGKGGLLAPYYWLTKDTKNKVVDVRFSVARADDGRSIAIDAAVGITDAEMAVWPEFLATLGEGTPDEKRQALRAGAVFLPPIVRDVLELKVGQAIMVNGLRATFGGTLNTSELQSLKHVDGQSVLPVNFQALESGQEQIQADKSETELAFAQDVARDFVHLSADQVVVGSADFVQRLGGKLFALSIYPGEGVDAQARGKELAETLVMPVWAAGSSGVERLLLTELTEISGGFALFVPLLLGGLIIFGTLLGSISDREKEIYTFSALGLSPGHVGVLFFAEAAVYAVVGGMGGQILAQFVALGASALAKAGYIKPAAINFSSTNSLFAIGVVMLTVLVSAIYPAVRASRSANPGLARSWRLPPPEQDDLKLKFPFTVSAYDITGVVSFLAEHFRAHDDAGLGSFAASEVAIRRGAQGNLELSGRFALAPFDLGVTQHMTLMAAPSEIEGVDEVAIHVTRESGAASDWFRANGVFMRELRQQFLLWRTLSNDMIEHYRMETLETLGPTEA